MLTPGALDLRKGLLVLHVPDMMGHYESVQFSDPTMRKVFTNIGNGTTGTRAGPYLITEPGWKGQTPEGMTQFGSPICKAIVIGHVLLNNTRDLLWIMHPRCSSNWHRVTIGNPDTMKTY